MTVYAALQRQIRRARALLAPAHPNLHELRTSGERWGQTMDSQYMDRLQHVCAVIQHNRITCMFVNGTHSDDPNVYHALDTTRPDIIGDATIEGFYIDGRWPLGLDVKR